MSLKRCKKNSRKLQYVLADLLNDVCKDLDKKFLVNCGGCCYIAYCIANILEQNNFKFSLIVFDDIHNLHDFVELSELPETMKHYAIALESQDEIHSDYINCDEDDFDCSYQTFKVSAKDILQYYLQNSWNEDYNSLYNKAIKHIIERVFYEFTETLCKR